MTRVGTVVTLGWNAVSGATEYVVLVGSAPGSSDQLSTNTTNTSYTWTAKGGRQYARVQAKCNGEFGSSSNEIDYTVGNWGRRVARADEVLTGPANLLVGPCCPNVWLEADSAQALDRTTVKPRLAVRGRKLGTGAAAQR